MRTIESERTNNRSFPISWPTPSIGLLFHTRNRIERSPLREST